MVAVSELNSFYFSIASLSPILFPSWGPLISFSHSSIFLITLHFQMFWTRSLRIHTYRNKYCQWLNAFYGLHSCIFKGSFVLYKMRREPRISRSIFSEMKLFSTELSSGGFENLSVCLAEPYIIRISLKENRSSDCPFVPKYLLFRWICPESRLRLLKMVLLHPEIRPNLIFRLPKDLLITFEMQALKFFWT